MLYEVLYQRRAAWLVGESKEEAAVRRRDAGRTSLPASQYPHDYAGRVVSLRRSGQKPSLRDMVGEIFQVAELDLTKTDLARLTNRQDKIGPGVLAPVTFDDRWGAVAETLRSNFADPAQAEAEQEDELSAEGRRFADLSTLAKQMLPKTITESGTGYYATMAVPTKVDDTQSGAPVGQVITLVTGGLGTADAFKGGYVTNVTQTETLAIVSHTDNTVTLEGALGTWVDTDDLDIYDSWSTIQAALDQLWADQGAAAFTASQYIRIFAGTYDEVVWPNNGLTPEPWEGFGLFIEGDRDANREDVIITHTAGSSFRTILFEITSCVLRHLTVTGVVTGALLQITSGTWGYLIDDCVFAPTAGYCAGWLYSHLAFRNCEFTVIEASGRAIYGTAAPSMHMENCKCTGPGKGVSTTYGIGVTYDLSVVACVVSGFQSAVSFGTWHALHRRIESCTVYDCDRGLYIHGTQPLRTIRSVNNIFKDVTYPYYLAVTALWPEESAAQCGSRYYLRNNCYHGYGSFAYDGSDTKTHAEWIAYELVDAAGELDATDPLLTDPVAGDFSLQADSPCLNTGHGSAVVQGQNAVAFDANHPDIGAWSSGDAAGHLTPVLDSVTNVGDGETVTLAVSNVEGSRTVHAFYRRFGSTLPFTESPTARTGPGNLSLGSLEDGTTYEVFVITSDGTSSDMPSLPSNLIVFMPSLILVGEETEREGQGNLDLQLTSDCRDIEVVNLDLALVDGTVQVKQALCIALRMFRGEWFLDANAGVPYYQNVLVKSPKLSEINSILKAEILKVEHVEKLLEFASEFDSASRELSVTFRVDTTFGPVTVEETL